MKLARGGGSWVIDFDFRLKVECSSYEQFFEKSDDTASYKAKNKQ